MAKKGKKSNAQPTMPVTPAGRPSSLLDTRVVYCGDNLEQLAKLPDACIDLIYIDPPFNSNRTIEQFGEIFWGETKEKRRDGHASKIAEVCARVKGGET